MDMQGTPSNTEYSDREKREIAAKIQRGIEELDRGEGIPEDQLDAYLAKLKTSYMDDDSDTAEPPESPL